MRTAPVRFRPLLALAVFQPVERPSAPRVCTYTRSRASRKGSHYRSMSLPVNASALPGEAVEKHLPEFIKLAHQLADAAAIVVKHYFRSPVAVEAKADASPVTEADRRAEAAMRDLIQAAYPEHGIFGEECGLHLPEGARRDGFLWVLDPIDGTKSFITGKPLFGILIALLYRGVPILGIIDQPILQERDIRIAYLYATSPHMFEGASETAFCRVRDEVKMPLYGCDCYAYGLLAAGLCDLVVEANMKPYDFMALVPIVEGAGGAITDWRGQKLQWHITSSHSYGIENVASEVLAAGDVAVHAQALQLLAWDEAASDAS